VLVLALAAIAAGGGTAVWLLEDDQGRDEIQRSLHDMPIVGRLVTDPDGP
jgi:type II secretory pathway component PulF